MAKPAADTKLDRILQNLFFQLSIGWRSLFVVKFIYQANEREYISSARYFFVSTYEACIESSILALARLVDRHKSYVTVNYLLDYALMNADAFGHADTETIRESVFQHREQLQDIAVLIERIKTHRDMTIAHLDRKHINQPWVIDSLSPINLHEVEAAFDLILMIINTYKGYFDSSAFRVDALGPIVEEDVEYLLELVSGADSNAVRDGHDLITSSR